MRWCAVYESPRSMRYEIKHDPSVGFYLYEFDSDRCIRDQLQDTFEIAVEVALEDYGVPKNAWKKIEA